MNKILLLLSIFCLIGIVGCVGVYYFNQPTYIFETINPQIICYGGGC